MQPARMVGSPDIESGPPLVPITVVKINGILSEVQATSGEVHYRTLRDEKCASNNTNIWTVLRLEDVFSVKLSGNAIRLYTYRRDVQKPSIWYPDIITIEFGSKNLQKEHMLRVIQAELEGMTHRPRNLLFFVNPVSGSKEAVYRYQHFIKPFFELGGVTCDMIETKKFDEEAHCEITKLLANIDGVGAKYHGVIAVGGDGLCTQLVNVCYNVYSRKHDCRRISPFILGHIPCGSTDALSSSLHGTRSMFTSMMHIALGDHIDIDALEVSLGNERKKLSVCIATCGFMADVIKFSDSLRILGPFRYDLAGALKIIQNKSYRCNVRYLKVNTQPEFDGIICRSRCPRCSSRHDKQAAGSLEQCHEGWTEKGIQEYMSIMILNTACVSDKSKSGMYKYGHLSDGCSYVVMVKKCSPLSYLSFLLSMATFGLSKHDSRYVEIVPVYKVEITSDEQGPLYWNLDGELEKAHRISAATRFASVPVFARGIEI